MRWVGVWLALALLIVAGDVGARGPHPHHPPGSDSNGSWDVFFGATTYVRETGPPRLDLDEFDVDQGQWATLRVFNGGVGGRLENRLSAASIFVNGRRVLGPFRIQRWRDTVEVPVWLRGGRNVIGVRLGSKPGRRIAVEIVGRGGLVRPSEDEMAAARRIQEELPVARLGFSQVDGRLMRLESSGPDGSDDDTLPIPLAESRGVDLEARVSAMLEALERFQDAFGVADPASVMAVAEDPFDEDPNPGKPGDPRRVLTQSLVQTHQGLRIRGRWVTGHFDGLGNLHSLVARIAPVGQTLGDKPSFGPELALELIAQQRDALIAREPGLWWLASGKIEDLESSVELLWAPTLRDPDAPLRLAYEVHLRRNLNLAALLVDAIDGEVVEATPTTPSDWFDDGTAGLVLAPDETGSPRFILSTVADDTLHMGFGNNWMDSLGRRWLAPGKHFAISDTAGRADLSLTYFDEIKIPFVNGNTWVTDPTYVGARRSATDLMGSLSRVLSYWAGFGWNSWDGRGGTLWASINNNKSRTGAPQLNAWGADGVLQIGDGTTATGRTAASSVEVVGHEFMHNVISATSRLVYRSESGAVNEALADLFGVAVTAVGDRYATDLIGDDAGWRLRDMVNPSNLGQPETYSAFRLTSGDSGGVHTNSGIANKAHSLVVEGGTFRGFPVTAQGVAATTAMVRSANRYRAFSPVASMEEFAASVVAYCNVTDALLRIFGGARLTPLCQSFTSAYRATQLYPGSNDADVVLENATINRPYFARSGWKRIDVELTNAGSGRQLLANYDVVVADELGDSLVPETNNWGGVGCNGSGPGGSFADPGEGRCFIGGLPGGFVDGYLTGIRRMTVSFEPPGAFADADPSNNWTRLRVGSDYLPYKALFYDNDVSQQTELRVQSRNGIGGFPAGLVGVFLTRSTAHGPLSQMAGDASQVLDPAVSPDRSTWDFPLGLVPYAAQDMPEEIEFVELPEATPMPGVSHTYQVWFDAAGGLDALDGVVQYYVLLDASDVADELNETNNLLCLNCHAPGQSAYESGVVVRLPLGTPVEALFPDAYATAAAKLPALNPRIYQFLSVPLPRLDPHVEPTFP